MEHLDHLDHRSTIEDSRRLLAGLVLQNRNRFSALPEDERNELFSALLQDAETYWNHAYSSAISDGKEHGDLDQARRRLLASSHNQRQPGDCRRLRYDHASDPPAGRGRGHSPLAV